MRNIELFELIGALATAAIVNGGSKLKLSDLAAIFCILDIESDQCDYYTNRTDFLIREAYDYFSNKGDAQTADNIKKTFTKKNGTAVVP